MNGNIQALAKPLGHPLWVFVKLKSKDNNSYSSELAFFMNSSTINIHILLWWSLLIHSSYRIFRAYKHKYTLAILKRIAIKFWIYCCLSHKYMFITKLSRNTKLVAKDYCGQKKKEIIYLKKFINGCAFFYAYTMRCVWQMNLKYIF